MPTCALDNTWAIEDGWQEEKVSCQKDPEDSQQGVQLASLECLSGEGNSIGSLVGLGRYGNLPYIRDRRNGGRHGKLPYILERLSARSSGYGNPPYIGLGREILRNPWGLYLTFFRRADNPGGKAKSLKDGYATSGDTVGFQAAV